MDYRSAAEAIIAIRNTVPDEEQLQLNAELAARLSAAGEIVAPIAVADQVETSDANVAIESGQVATANVVTAPIVVPEVDPETHERLNSLPEDYRERVLVRYNDRYIATDGYIRAGKLPEAYRLPELGDLVDRVIAIAPAYETINNQGGQAELDFVPRGLTIEQWDDLLSGHKLPGGETSRGAYRYHNVNKVTDPTNPNADASLWDAAVMDVSPNPKVRGIAADGSKAASGYNLKKSLKTLREAHSAIGLPELDASTSNLSAAELLIKQLSPSEETKFAIQLGRLERGEQPVDPNGIWTIGKENVKVGDALGSVFSSFFSSNRRAYSNYDDRDFAYGSRVVRVSARGRDFIPQS